MVMVVETGLAHAGVLRHRVMGADPAPGRPRAGVRSADAAEEIALQAGVSHAAVRAMLAGLAFAVRGVDEAAIRAGPRLIIGDLPVLAALEEDDRLLPERRAAGVVGLLERLERLLEVGEVRPIRLRAVADTAVGGDRKS